MPSTISVDRRTFLGAAALGSIAVASTQAQDKPAAVLRPPEGKRILLSCKLGMVAKKDGDRTLSHVERLKMAKDAGFDGIDFDEAGLFTPEQARDASREAGVFVHNAINHAHWNQRLTSAKDEERAQGRAHRALHSRFSCDWRLRRADRGGSRLGWSGGRDR